MGIGAGLRRLADTGPTRPITVPFSLDKIARRARETGAVLEGVNAGTKHQATALAEVNTTVDRRDRMTQENAATVDETAITSRGLAGTRRR